MDFIPTTFRGLLALIRLKFLAWRCRRVGHRRPPAEAWRHRYKGGRFPHTMVLYANCERCGEMITDAKRVF